MDEQRFRLSEDELTKTIALDDTQEQVIIVMSEEQVDVLLDWYCKKRGYLIIA